MIRIAQKICSRTNTSSKSLSMSAVMIRAAGRANSEAGALSTIAVQVDQVNAVGPWPTARQYGSPMSMPQIPSARMAVAAHRGARRSRSVMPASLVGHEGGVVGRLVVVEPIAKTQPIARPVGLVGQEIAVQQAVAGQARTRRRAARLHPTAARGCPEPGADAVFRQDPRPPTRRGRAGRARAGQSPLVSSLRRDVPG